MDMKRFGTGLGSAAAVVALLAGCGTATNNTTSTGGASNNTSTTSTNTAATNTTSNNTSTGAASSSSGDKNVVIGYINWSEDVAATYLWKDLLEKKGYKVTLKQLPAAELFAGMSQGSLNVFFDTWLPNTHKSYMKRFGSNLTDLGKWYQGKTTEGFVVPKYMTNVNSIGDLKGISSKLNGKIVGIEAGAGETGIAKKAIKDYNLPETLQTSSTPAMLTALKRAYAKKQPIVVTLWSPHWAFAKYNLKYLKDPKGDFGSGGWIQAEANKKWASAHPSVVKWIGNFKVNQAQLGALENDINTASTKDAGVKKWISSNQSLVNQWFS